MQPILFPEYSKQGLTESCIFPLGLPNEVLLHIFSYLADSSTPVLCIVGRVCRRFRAIIKSTPHLRSETLPKIRGRQLHYAELIHPYLFPKGFLPCYFCNILLAGSRKEFNFPDFEYKKASISS